MIKNIQRITKANKTDNSISKGRLNKESMSRDRCSEKKRICMFLSNMHKKVKEATGTYKVSNNGRLHDKDNQIIR